MDVMIMWLSWLCIMIGSSVVNGYNTNPSHVTKKPSEPLQHKRHIDNVDFPGGGGRGGCTTSKIELGRDIIDINVMCELQ